MREILFRGKREEDGGWIYGLYSDDYVYDTDFPCVVPLRSGAIYESWSVIRDTVGQYTGLLDKNGKKIFEGDIVESRASDNKEDWKRWIVTFYDGSLCFEREISRKRKHKHEQNLLCVDEVKLYGLAVIGNIYDNPELLKGE